MIETHEVRTLDHFSKGMCSLRMTMTDFRVDRNEAHPSAIVVKSKTSDTGPDEMFAVFRRARFHE